MPVTPYLFFEGRCEEALEFYKSVLGAEMQMLMRYSDSPDPNAIPPGAEDKIMHASFSVRGTSLMASDGHCSGEPNFSGASLSITADSAEEAESLFAALGEGGEVQMPMGKLFFAERFGSTRDKFGLSWMVIFEGAP